MHESFDAETVRDERPLLEASSAGADVKQAAADDAPKPRRKRKLTEEKQTEICAMISVGCSERTAARLADCSETAARNLVRRDKAFAQRFRQAAIRREVFPLRAIINASQSRWRAAAWYLARLNPNEYGSQKPETVTPEMLENWLSDLGEAILEAVQDQATRDRIAEVLGRLLPKADRYEEMRPVKMPRGYDAQAEYDKKYRRGKF